MGNQLLGGRVAAERDGTAGLHGLFQVLEIFDLNGETRIFEFGDQFLDLGAGGGVLAHTIDEQADEHLRFRSEEHTSELQSLMRISYAVFCLKKHKSTLNTL